MQLLNNVMNQRMLPANDLRLLVLADPYVELSQLLCNHVPIVLLGESCGLVFQVVELRVKRERLLRFLDYGLAYYLHQSSNIVGVLETLRVLPMELDTLLLNFDLVALIVLEVTAINHPEVEVYIQGKHLSLGDNYEFLLLFINIIIPIILFTYSIFQFYNNSMFKIK